MADAFDLNRNREHGSETGHGHDGTHGGTTTTSGQGSDPTGRGGNGHDDSGHDNTDHHGYDGTHGSDPTTGGATQLLCFMAGTRIATPDGETAVEMLQPGDLVVTAQGAAVPVRWIGRQTVTARFADPDRSLPIRIKAGALGGGMPRRDLLLSPGHAVFVDGILVNAAAAVNGISIVRENNVPEVFTYYHVELAEHTLILAEGAKAETFVDNASREHFDNYADRAALGDAAPITEMDLARAYSFRQIPAATHQRLTALAEQLYGSAVAAAA